MAIDRSDAHARGAGDFRHLDLVPAFGEERGRGFENASAITSGIGAQAAWWVRHEMTGLRSTEVDSDSAAYSMVTAGLPDRQPGMGYLGD
ncbi:hypothetical protein FMUAM8_20990 [Nocardia cyriacigeorgica]|nr:hypothetical protein FMUAM8_20990 [Nocardia cyriacigeorgica]BDU05817.1 hypothetical protein FMUBM48_20800 [Nocardia cyriacigeorgica]